MVLYRNAKIVKFFFGVKIMYRLFEKGDTLNTPIECFEFCAGREAFPVRPHWHYFLEMILVIEGTLTVRSGGEEFTLAPGEFALFYPKQVHEIDCLTGEAPVFLGIKTDVNVLGMDSAYIPKLRGILSGAERQKMRTRFPKDFTEVHQFERLFRECIAEVNQQRYGYDTLLRSNLNKIIISVLRIWQDAGFTVENRAFTNESDIDIYTVTEFIDRNISSRIKVSDIAAKVNMSYSCFSRKFLEVYGKSCKDYMDDMRLVMVEDYLRFTDLDLTSIALETGYTDCSHMIKCFKESKGITPKQYRTKFHEG